MLLTGQGTMDVVARSWAPLCAHVEENLGVNPDAPPVRVAAVASTTILVNPN
jgi:hypothetical protein